MKDQLALLTSKGLAATFIGEEQRDGDAIDGVICMQEVQLVFLVFLIQSVHRLSSKVFPARGNRIAKMRREGSAE